MPILTLKYTENLKNLDFVPFFQKAHDILSQTLSNVKPTGCVSMAVSHAQYLVGDGLENSGKKGYIHVDILVKAGRDPKSLQLASESVLAALNGYLKLQNSDHTIISSVNVLETSYFSNG